MHDFPHCISATLAIFALMTFACWWSYRAGEKSVLDAFQKYVDEQKNKSNK
jgi:hypothetical protein